jgi:hypothetical protein
VGDVLIDDAYGIPKAILGPARQSLIADLAAAGFGTAPAG